METNYTIAKLNKNLFQLSNKKNSTKLLDRAVNLLNGSKGYCETK